MPKLLSTGELTLDVEVVDTLDHAVPPVSTPEIDAAVRRSLSLTKDGWLVLDPDLGDPLLADLALSLRVEALVDGTAHPSTTLVATTFDALASSACVHTSGEQPIAFWSLEGLDGADGPPRTGMVRARGVSDDVLFVPYGKRRWSGELLVPVDELLARENELAPEGRELFWTPR